jgi:hypothetical protein
LSSGVTKARCMWLAAPLVAGCHLLAGFDDVVFVDGSAAGSGGGGPTTFRVSLDVSGLAGGGLVVTLNGGESLTVDESGVHTFTTELADGDAFAVTLAQPSLEQCSAEGAEGTVAGGDVVVTIRCLPLVMPLYPSLAPLWNQYANADGSDVCVPAAVGRRRDCVHGGEQRFMLVAGIDSCAGISASDSENAFVWQCDDSTLPLRFRTKELSPGSGLTSLVSFEDGAFKTMTVTVRDGAGPLVTSVPTVWWANPVEPVAAALTLDSPDTVYLVTEDPGAPVVLGSDVSLAVMPGVTLTAAGTPAAVVAAQDAKFVWFEGAVAGGTATDAIAIDNVPFTVLRNVTVDGAAENTVALLGTRCSALIDVEAHDAGYSGIILQEGAGSELRRVRTWNNGLVGIGVLSGRHVVLDEVVVTSSTAGLAIADSEAGVASHLVIANNLNGVVASLDSPNWVFGDVTTMSNDATGFSLEGESAVVMNVTAAQNRGAFRFEALADPPLMHLFASNLIAVNNGGGSDGSGDSGLRFYGVQSSTVRNVAATNNADYAFELGVDGDQFLPTDLHVTGMVKIDATATCQPLSGSLGVAADCGITGTSDHTLVDDTYLGDSFVGKVVSDSVNTSHSGGLADHARIRDWVHFERWHRGWGLEGGLFPDPNSQRNCFDVTCRIWDWALASTQDELRGLNEIPDGDATFEQTWMVTATSQADCDAAIPGSLFEGPDDCRTTFLLDALEVMFDGAGNDNLLCESNETCIVVPNFGAYQGHGALTNAGNFTSGTIVGVTLMRYTTNGYFP